MWIGAAAQGIRQRVFKHQLIGGRRFWLPIGANGKTRQKMGCNLIHWIAKERIGERLDMSKTDHQIKWRGAVDRVFEMDLRCLILPAVVPNGLQNRDESPNTVDSDRTVPVKGEEIQPTGFEVGVCRPHHA